LIVCGIIPVRKPYFLAKLMGKIGVIPAYPVGEITAEITIGFFKY
jgi:hypothetical protein